MCWYVWCGDSCELFCVMYVWVMLMRVVLEGVGDFCEYYLWFYFGFCLFVWRCWLVVWEYGWVGFVLKSYGVGVGINIGMVMLCFIKDREYWFNWVGVDGFVRWW